MKFSEKLRQARKSASLTQTELGQKLGVSKNTIINWESGKIYPHNRETYRKIADVLSVNENYLRNEDEYKADREGLMPDDLMSRVSAMFAGGDMAEEDMDRFMSAVNRAYWEAKDMKSKNKTD